MNNTSQSNSDQPAQTELQSVSKDILLQTGDIVTVAPTTTYGAETTVVPGNTGQPVSDDLRNFFARPILLNQITWNAAFAGAQVFPWADYMADVRIKEKTRNYALFRGTLHVVFIYTSNPYVFGGIRVCYNPFGTANQAGIARGTALSYATPDMVAYLNASASSGAHFICPFYYDTPWFNNATNGNGSWQEELKNAGELEVVPVSPIGRADGVAGASLVLSVYAWMENVELAAPSYFPQMGEYKRGPINQMATTFARFAGKFVDIPLLAPYARATEIASTALAGIAGIFGFSKPATTSDATVVVARAYSRLAFTSGLDSCEKLSTDPKQEISISPATVGLPPYESSTIHGIASRESYFCAFNLSTTDTPGKYITSWAVSPKVFDPAFGVDIRPSHIMWASLPFGMWTGSLIYRFRIFGSPFIRGRIYIFYDPAYGALTQNGVNYPLMSTLNPYGMLTTNRYCMLDLASDTDMEFRVGWAQSQRWGRNPIPYPFNTDITGQNNGRVGVFVDSPLSAPGACTITVLVTIRAGEDFRVADPALESLNQYQMQGPLRYRPQSNLVSNTTVEAGKAEMCDLYEGTSDIVVASSNNVGEQIVSMRAMAKRYCALVTLVAPASGTANIATDIVSYDFSPWPLPRRTGVGTNGLNLWSYSSWWSCCHASMRGGVRLKFVHNIPPNIRAIFTISRLSPNDQNTASTNGYGYRFPRRGVYATPQLGTSTAFLSVNSTVGNGAMIIDAHAPGGLEVEIPWHWYQDCLPAMIDNNKIATSQLPFIRLTIETTQYDLQYAFVKVLTAAAEDFTPFAYVGPPPVIRQVPITAYPTWA